MNAKILIVDDEPSITALLEEVLQKDGFCQIVTVHTGKDAIWLCREFEPDVIVLDIMLPDMDGIEICRQVRSFSHCSILFLSSKNDDVDKILGLSAGGDDYITKPFSPRELVFRIKAQLRRQQYHREDFACRKAEPLCVGALTIDTDACCAYLHGELLELTAREFSMLQFFMENANKVISKERIYEQVWGEISIICDNTIMVHIRHLREKIEANPSSPQILLTVKGLGYKLVSGEKL